jgi:hypothetical protein
MMPRVSFGPLFTEALDHADRRLAQLRIASKPRSLVEMALEEESTAGGRGDECLSSIRSMLLWLDDHGHERSPQQVELQEAFLKASLRFIYKGEFDSSIERVMRENDWSVIYQEVLIGTPRRFGKTYSTSEYACVFILAVRGARVCIYSTGKDTAIAVLDHIRMFFRVLPCYTDFDILIDNEKTLKIAPKNNPTDVRVVKSYTSNAKIRRLFHTNLFLFCVGYLAPSGV